MGGQMPHRGGSGYVARSSSSGLYDVLELILDKGLVIDVFVRVSLIGIEILTIDARIVIASVDTYLRFAEAVNRLDLMQTETQGLPDMMRGAHGERRLEQDEGCAAGREGGPVRRRRRRGRGRERRRPPRAAAAAAPEPDASARPVVGRAADCRWRPRRTRSPSTSTVSSGRAPPRLTHPGSASARWASFVTRRSGRSRATRSSIRSRSGGTRSWPTPRPSSGRSSTARCCRCASAWSCRRPGHS